MFLRAPLRPTCISREPPFVENATFLLLLMKRFHDFFVIDLCGEGKNDVISLIEGARWRPKCQMSQVEWGTFDI